MVYYLGRESTVHTTMRLVDEKWRVVTTLLMKRSEDLVEWEEQKFEASSTHSNPDKAMAQATLQIELKLEADNGSNYTKISA